MENELFISNAHNNPENIKTNSFYYNSLNEKINNIPLKDNSFQRNSLEEKNINNFENKQLYNKSFSSKNIFNKKSCIDFLDSFNKRNNQKDNTFLYLNENNKRYNKNYVIKFASFNSPGNSLYFKLNNNYSNKKLDDNISLNYMIYNKYNTNNLSNRNNISYFQNEMNYYQKYKTHYPSKYFFDYSDKVFDDYLTYNHRDQYLNENIKNNIYNDSKLNTKEFYYKRKKDIDKINKIEIDNKQNSYKNYISKIQNFERKNNKKNNI